MAIKLQEKHEQLILFAKKEIEIADHLLYMTYPMIKETKFLIAIADHIIKSARAALQALLEYERFYKRIEIFPHNFAMEVSIYRQKVESRYSFDPKFYRLLGKLLEVYRFDKNSTVRFRRGERYILTSSNYEMTVLDVGLVKRYSSLTRKFAEQVAQIIKKGGTE